MISLRHHAISLAAVFLALAVGVVLGSSALSGAILPGVQEQKKDLSSQLTSLTLERDALNGKLGAAEEFTTQISGRVVRDALPNASVVIFTTPDAASDDITAVQHIIGQAGATVTATIALTEEFVAAHSAEKLRSVVNSSILPAGAQLNTTLQDQGSAAGDLLGITLFNQTLNQTLNQTSNNKLGNDQTSPNVEVDNAARITALAALRDTGFMTYSDDQMSAADAAIVITGGELGDDAGNQGSTVARFSAALAGHGSGVVLAGRDGSGQGTAAVAVARADRSITDVLSTVDDVNAESGRITTVLALQSLFNGASPGQYGTGPGAVSVTLIS